MSKIKQNDIITAVVTGIQTYGAFVDVNGDYNGLIHISEISYGYVKNINDFVKIGDKIYAQVIDIDQKNGKLKLSIKNIDYKKDGKILNNNKDNKIGFEPLKEHLDSWINEKIKEIMKKI